MPRWSWFLLWTVLCSGALGVFGALAVHLGRRAAALGREILRAAELLGDSLPAPEHPAVPEPTAPEPTAPSATGRNRPGRNA